MPLNAKPADHPNFPPHGRTGLLLVNLGTPEGTDKKSMRKYLKQFLSDPRVIEVSRPLWWVILNGIILNVRPKKSGSLYDRIWLHDDPDGSPLRKITRLQAEHLSSTFKQDNLVVDYAMRYGAPSISGQLQKLTDMGCTQIVVMPLYPQYAASTTATVNDELFKWMLDRRWQPAIRTVPPWHDNPAYIAALADSVAAANVTLEPSAPTATSLVAESARMGNALAANTAGERLPVSPAASPTAAATQAFWPNSKGRNEMTGCREVRRRETTQASHGTSNAPSDKSRPTVLASTSWSAMESEGSDARAS